MLWYEHSEPYGKSMTRVSQTGNEILNDRAGTRKGYTDHLNDTAADLVYMKARYYDPQIGRFYSNDPFGFTVSNPMMFNRYGYVNGNPYLFKDPTGRVLEFVNPQQEAIFNTAFSTISSHVPEFGAIIEALHESQHVHRFELTQGDEAPFNDPYMADNTAQDTINRILEGKKPIDGAGSLTKVGPRKKDGYEIELNDGRLHNTGPLSALAHEVQHAYDRDQGICLTERSPNNTDPYDDEWTTAEDRAMEMEQKVNEAFNEGFSREGVY